MIEERNVIEKRRRRERRKSTLVRVMRRMKKMRIRDSMQMMLRMKFCQSDSVGLRLFREERGLLAAAMDDQAKRELRRVC